MAHTSKTLGTLGVILSLLWLAACANPAPTQTSEPAPSLDANALRTEVAATVLARVTRELALTPSITPIPSATATLVPTATSLPTQVPSPTTGVTLSLTETLTTEPPVEETANRAEWVSQSIADDTIFAPGEPFTLTWRLKNVGETTWLPLYMLRFYSGNTFGAPEEILINEEVLPGAEVDITLVMKAPTVVGKYQSVWVMASETRGNFKEPVYLQIVVAVPATPTPTPQP